MNSGLIPGLSREDRRRMTAWLLLQKACPRGLEPLILQVRNLTFFPIELRALYGTETTFLSRSVIISQM